MSTIFIDALAALHGGGQTYLTNLLTRLPPDEPRIIYLLAQRGFGTCLAGERVRLLHADWRVENPFVRAAWEKLFVRRHAERVGASVLFFPGGMVSAAAPLGCRRVTMFRNPIPFDPTQRAKYPLGYPRLRNWLLERLLLKSMLEADLVIFLSDSSRSLVERRAGRPLPRSVTIPHGVGPAFRAPSGAPRPSWLPDTPYVLYVSSFEPYKAQLEVVRAFSRVVKEWREPLSLVLAGPDQMPYARIVRREIEKLSLHHRVLMPGNRPYAELPAIHHHSLIGIFASEVEICPNSLLEAMASGRAVLCSSRPPMPEFGGDELWYFDPSEPGELAALLLRLLREPETRERLGAAAARRATRYDWDETARRTWAALTSC